VRVTAMAAGCADQLNERRANADGREVDRPELEDLASLVWRGEVWR
jgi:hypothetical protein